MELPLDHFRLLGISPVASAEQVLWALLHGLIALPMTEPDHPWAPGLAENAVDSLLRGMTSRPAELQP